MLDHVKLRCLTEHLCTFVCICIRLHVMRHICTTEKYWKIQSSKVEDKTKLQRVQETKDQASLLAIWRIRFC